MRLLFVLLLTLFTSFPSVASDAPKEDLSIVRFDGIYQTDKEMFKRKVVTIDGKELDGSYSYLRFYGDGNVISTSSTGTLSEIVGWFQLGQEHILQGQYRQENGKISFSVTSPDGSIDYVGSVQDGKLVLHSHSNINGYESDKVFNFVAMPSDRG